MASELSAYSILGLEPGADHTAIDEAYRRLIKQHHPDRSGGDANRAAEINRAYRELRRKPPVQAESSVSRDISEAIYARRASRSRVPPPGRRKRKLWPFLLVALAALAFVQRDRLIEEVPALGEMFTQAWSPALGTPASAPAKEMVTLDAPLAEAVIRSSIREASSLAGGASGDRLAERSRECHRTMRAEATLTQLDRCAAFDYAVALTDGRDLVQDEGPFSASAVTARQMAAASLLSDDFLAIEARLDRIRSRVELTLYPQPAASGSPQPSS